MVWMVLTAFELFFVGKTLEKSVELKTHTDSTKINRPGHNIPHCKKSPLDATRFCLEIETKYANWD